MENKLLQLKEAELCAPFYSIDNNFYASSFRVVSISSTSLIKRSGALCYRDSHKDICYSHCHCKMRD